MLSPPSDAYITCPVRLRWPEQEAPPQHLPSILLPLQGCTQTSAESSRKRSCAATPHCPESKRKPKSLPGPQVQPGSSHHTPAPMTLLPIKLSFGSPGHSKVTPQNKVDPHMQPVTARFIPSRSYILCLGQSLKHTAEDSLESLTFLGRHHAQLNTLHPFVHLFIFLF